MRHLLTGIIGAVCASFVMTGTALSAIDFEYDGPPITITLSSFTPSTHPVIKNSVILWEQEIAEETDGKIKIKSYHNGVLHSAKDGFKALVSGISDLTPAYTMYQPASFHLVHVLDLPFAFPSAAVAAKVAEELYPKYFKKEYEAMGVYMANFNANGLYNLFSKKPITSLSDLKGFKIRSAGGTSSEIIKHIGAIPTAVPVSEAYNAFQRGIVDGVLIYNSGAVGYRLDELASDITDIRINDTPLAWGWSKKKWDSFPESVKKYLYIKQRQLGMWMATEFDRQDELAREKFLDEGIAIHELSPDEFKRWQEAVEPLWENFIESNESEGRPARQLVEDLRNLVEKYSSWTPEELMHEVTENPIPNLIDGM